MRQPRSEMITIRVTEAFQLRVRDAAEAENLTVTAYIINAINERMRGSAPRWADGTRKRRAKINGNGEKDLEHSSK